MMRKAREISVSRGRIAFLFSPGFGCALAWLLLFPEPPAVATKAAADRTGKKCEVCHVSRTSKKLNIVGTYYKRKNTLAGAPLEEQQREDRMKTRTRYYH